MERGDVYIAIATATEIDFSVIELVVDFATNPKNAKATSHGMISEEMISKEIKVERYKVEKILMFYFKLLLKEKEYFEYLG